MTALWPAELPRPLRDGYRQSAVEARGARSAETGPPAYARRYSSVPRSVALSLVLSRSQKAVFDRFWRDTTRHGARPFFMPDPTTDGWPLLTPDGQYLLGTGGTPLLLSAQWLCLFGDSLPAETLRGASFTLSFDIWVMP